MLSSKYQLERALFEACLALDPAEWSGYLSRHCPDDAELRARVARLLEAHRQSENSTAPDSAGFDVGERMPESIGPYRILHPLGEGGMGVVYAAEQTHPLRRKVALKVVRAGMDSRQVVARFFAERQALAVMDHPNIAKVLDAGETPEGRPYFVMELVAGQPVHDYCEQHRLGTGGKLRLFALIAHAVQHAHQKGVIHRDLKPGNVLVSGPPDAPTPRIIDFGIAKAVEGDLLDFDVVTRQAHVIGTPSYMSPEQASGGLVDIDTRTDIYSLGVLFYQVLTGRLPFDNQEWAPAEFLARLAKQELEAPRPSEVRPELKGDLDWIVMKAMAPDRARRYETAAALAEDLERYLRDETVAARPPTARYLVAKFVRRHRGEVLAGAFAVVALFAGLVSSTVSLLRAQRAEQLARQEAAAAREVSNLLTSLFVEADPGESRGRNVTARELIQRGAERVTQDLKKQPAVQARLLTTLSRVQASLGLYQDAHDLAGLAHHADPNLAEAVSQRGLAQVRLGDFAGARQSLEQALALCLKQSGPESLAAAKALRELGGLEWQLGRLDEALRYHQQALELHERLLGPDSEEAALSLRGVALVKAKQEKPQEAVQLFQRAQALFERAYGQTHPLVADNLDSLALAQADLKQYAAARQNHEAALRIRTAVLGPKHPVLAYSYLNLARLASDEKRFQDALPLFEKGLRLREETLGPRHPRTADIVESLAILYARNGQLDKAQPLFERSHSIYLESHGPADPETLESRRNLAILHTLRGRYPEAIRQLTAVLDNGGDNLAQLDAGVFQPLRKYEAFRALEQRLTKKQ